MDERIARIISKAKVQFLFQHPFLAVIAMSLTTRKDTEVIGCNTMATDGKTLWIDEDFIKKIEAYCKEKYGSKDILESHTIENVMGVLAHELLHIVFSHTSKWRKSEDYNSVLWTMACELVVNEAVTETFSLPLPFQPLLDKQYCGMYTEQVYYKLLKQYPPNKQKALVAYLTAGTMDIKDILGSRIFDKHLERNLSQKQQEEEKQAIKLLIVKGVQAAREKGKLPSSIERFVETELMEPKIPWRRVLAEFLTNTARNDYTWSIPNRRHLSRGFVLPSLRSPEAEIAVAIDTSGSISDNDINEFWQEVNGIMAAISAYKIHLMACDADVHSYQEVTPWEPADLSKIKGGGGTDFRPVFKKVEDEGLQPKVLVYLTDAMGEFPPEPPPYPVLWVVKGDKEVSWGSRCELDN